MSFTQFKLSLNITLPCPTNATQTHPNLPFHPSTSLIYTVFAVTSLVFALIIAFKYNSVKVFNRKIRTQNISNTLWIIYYLCMFARTSADTLSYALKPSPNSNSPYGKTYDDVFLASLVVQGLATFALCLSLNHQRKYRSSAPPNPPQQQASPNGGNGGAKEPTEPLLGGKPTHWLRRSISVSEIVFFILFIIYIVFLALANFYPPDHHTEFVDLYIAAFVLQRVPILILVIIIIATRNGNEGPTQQSKIFLAIAAVLSVVDILPIFAWAQIFASMESQCYLYFNFVDGLIVINLLSLIFFFLFLRSEYLRNMEECIWTTVSQIQDTFDFRRF